MIGIFFATGFEEVEALTVVDLLRRAKLDTKMISIYSKMQVTGSHGIEVTMDDSLDNLNFNELDAIVLPGGAPGFKNLEQCDNLMSKVVSFASNPDKLVAAICGAPSLLGHKNLVNGRKATIYPGMDQELYGAEVSHDSVVTDGNIITSRGVGTAIDFALAIVSYYQGKEAAESLAKKIVY